MPNCPSCDDIEMIAETATARVCPACGYREDH